MTASPPARLRLSSDVDVPPVVERLLLDVVQDGFVLYCCGGRAEPSALVASYEWEHYVDLVVIRGADRVTAARVPKEAGFDVFAPEVVVCLSGRRGVAAACVAGPGPPVPSRRPHRGPPGTAVAARPPE